ncbi:MAG: RIP metalloprotease RseP [bacterium]|nr:RIP metalloprotease RseP [bacterium]
MILSIICFILVLGVTVLVHEFGHFLFAKLSNTYVYEFSIGMGKKLWSIKSKKNKETEYCLRLIPIGGYVRLAGEEVEDDDKIPKDRKLWSKTFWQRFLIMFAGAGFNFIFAFVVLFGVGLIFGSVSTSPVIGEVVADYPIAEAGITTGSKILKVNGTTVKNWDSVFWILEQEKGEGITFEIKDTTGEVKSYTIIPKEVEENGEVVYKFGMSVQKTKQYGIVASWNYACSKMESLFTTMFKVFGSLFTGSISVSELSGPVGIYSIVDEQAKQGIDSLLYLVAFLSINVGFINLLPFPAFDGGRILFLIIEKIKGSPVNPKVENTIHNIGFCLLIILMLYVTFNDVLRLFS